MSIIVHSPFLIQIFPKKFDQILQGHHQNIYQELARMNYSQISSYMIFYTQRQPAPGNGKGGLERIRTNFVKIFFCKKPIRTEINLSSMHLSAVILLLILLHFFWRKISPAMEVRTMFFGKSRGGQVHSGQIGRASVRTKGAFSGSASATITPVLQTCLEVAFLIIYIKNMRPLVVPDTAFINGTTSMKSKQTSLRGRHLVPVKKKN